MEGGTGRLRNWSPLGPLLTGIQSIRAVDLKDRSWREADWPFSDGQSRAADIAVGPVRLAATDPKRSFVASTRSTKIGRERNDRLAAYGGDSCRLRCPG